MDRETESSAGQSGHKKRQRTTRSPAWKDQSAFLDASASISVATFGARRLVELKQLYHASNKGPIEAEQVAFQSGGGQTSSRHLRRRTTSHQSRRHRHRFPTAAPPSAIAATTNTTAPSQTRKAKRSSSHSLCHGHLTWHNLTIPTATADSTPNTDAPTKEPPPHWMMTHIWHAKRFHMEHLWGWQVPVAHTNRGARAVLRLTSSSSSSPTTTTSPPPHCTLQDLTFCRKPLSIRSSRDCTKDQFAKCIARILPEWNTDPTSILTLLQEEDGPISPRMGESVLHHLDQFPRGAIGPVWWHVTEYQHSSTEVKQWDLHLRVHPSIRSTVLTCLQAIQSANPHILQFPPSPSSTDDTKSSLLLCCFQIGGAKATAMIQDIFQPRSCTDVDDTTECDWATFLEHKAATKNPIRLRHGSVVRVVLDFRSIDSNHAGDDKKKSTNVLLVRQAPRPLDCDSNLAVSGWDLYCDPDHALAIWMALALKSVVIGIVEQSHIQLECEPPLPIFPRDYIDTEESKRYWASNSKTEKEESDWSTIRKLYEGGWGRLPTKKTIPLIGVSWKDLIHSQNDSKVEGDSEDDDSESQNSDSVVVRGAFGQPFLVALEGCGQLSPSSKTTNPDSSARRRKRRRSTATYTVKKAQSFNKDRREKWRQMVQTLLESLSLPAVLQAHIRVAGQGTVKSGDKIFVADCFVGFATTGSFSPHRGVCHGLAILGAARVLEALMGLDGFSTNQGRIVPLSNGKTQIQLAGSTRQAPDTRTDVTIALIL